MKKYFVLSFFFALSLISRGQWCVVPAWAETNLNHFHPVTYEGAQVAYQTNFANYHYYLTEPYWDVLCGGPYTIPFSRWVIKGHLTDTEVYYEVSKRPFDCADGSQTGNWSVVSVTPTVSSPASASATSYIESTFNITVEQGHVYRTQCYRRHKILGIWSNWNVAGRIDIVFGMGGVPEPVGNFVDVLNVDPRTSTGTGYIVDVHQLDVNGPFEFDATPTDCETKWRYEISEFDLNSWTSSNAILTPWISGQAGLIDMNTTYTYGFVRNKLYLLKLIAGEGWFEDYYWFEIKDAHLEGDVTGGTTIESVTSGGVTTNYTLHRSCFGGNVKLFTEGTHSVDQYRVRIQPVDNSYSLTGTEQSTGIVPGPVPAEISLNALYGAPLVLNQRYRIVYEITSPGNTALYYYQPIDCGAYKTTNKKDIASEQSVSEALLIVSLYPNPANTELTIAFNSIPDAQAALTILDVSGRQVYATTTNTTQTVINTSALADGMYLVQIEMQGQTLTKRFTVRH